MIPPMAGLQAEFGADISHLDIECWILISGIQGSGFRVQGSGFRVQGSGFRKEMD